eukprot:gene17087-22600_t
MYRQKPNERTTHVGSTTFTLDKRYNDIKLIGQGSYGVVCSVYDSKLGKKVAIKKITPMAKHVEDAKHVLREIRLMRYLDFGLARERPTGLGPTSDDHVEEPMTEHVITRWYRPPELMLCPDGLYTYAVDMWSCGCILGEMLGRNPMFPGKNFIHQLTLIFDVIGSPKQSEIKH